MLDLTRTVAVLLGSFVSFLVFIYFIFRFFEIKHYQRLLRAIAFFVFFIASAASLILGSPNDYSAPIAAVGMVILYSSLALDEHSHLRYTLPLPFLALYFFKGHELLLVLSLMDAIALLELSYTREHQRLIPLSSALIIVAIAEYFYVFGPNLKEDSAVGPILYIFTSVIFLLWILFMMIKKTFKLFTNDE